MAAKRDGIRVKPGKTSITSFGILAAFCAIVMTGGRHYFEASRAKLGPPTSPAPKYCAAGQRFCALVSRYVYGFFFPGPGLWRKKKRQGEDHYGWSSQITWSPYIAHMVDHHRIIAAGFVRA